MNTSSKRADQLQFLRFIAFSLIFLWHTHAWFPKSFPAGEGAGLAVSFFIFLSGTVTAYSSYGREHPVTLKSSFDRVKLKMKKVYPLFFVTTMFMVCASEIPSLISNYDFKDLIPQLLELVKDMLLIQSWFPKNYFTFNGVAWFLSTIMLCYFLENPLLALADKIKKDKKPCLMLFLAGVIASDIIIVYCYLLRNTNVEFTQYVFPPSRIGEFFIGICIGYTARICEEKDLIKIKSKVFFTVLEIASLALWFYSLYIIPEEIWKTRIVQAILPNVILLTVFILGKGYVSNLFATKPLLTLGDVSFECFLIHLLVINEYSSQSQSNTETYLGKAFAIFFCLFLTVLISLLVSRKLKFKPREKR